MDSGELEELELEAGVEFKHSSDLLRVACWCCLKDAKPMVGCLIEDMGGAGFARFLRVLFLWDVAVVVVEVPAAETAVVALCTIW